MSDSLQHLTDRLQHLSFELLSVVLSERNLLYSSFGKRYYTFIACQLDCPLVICTYCIFSQSQSVTCDSGLYR
jgi:hypothetical protein